MDVYLNQGNGTFKLSATNAPFGNGLVVADLNVDGIPDLAASTNTAVSIQQGNGDGTFQALPSTACLRDKWQWVFSMDIPYRTFR